MHIFRLFIFSSVNISDVEQGSFHKSATSDAGNVGEPKLRLQGNLFLCKQRVKGDSIRLLT